jgi:signal transduction histidine kinase
VAASPSTTTTTADPRRTGTRGAVLTGLVILVFAAVVFATSTATKQTARDGLVAQRAEAVLGGGDLALKALAQAVLLAEDRNLGVADDDTVQLALDEATSTLGSLQQAAAALGDVVEDEARTAAAVRAVDAGESVLRLLVEDRVPEAGSALAGDTKAIFETLRDLVAAERDAHEVALTSSNSLAARVSNVARFLVALLLPLGAILAYRIAARRQLRVAEIQLDARLEAEHHVIRAKDEFIANMSHELRTPLTSIYGFSELLLESGLVDPESALDLVTLINTESAELGRMVEDLLVSARAETGGLVFSLEDVNVAREAATVVEPFLRDGRSIAVEVPANEVRVDPLRVRQMIRNLVANALRYGGPAVRISGTVDGDRMIVDVEDDGPGVPAEMEPRLFTRFVHEGDAALTVGSVGLGLAVVKSLAEGMGGGVGYERHDGWTRFRFWVPLASAAATATAPILDGAPGAGGVSIAAATPLEPGDLG